jgi:ribosomal protein L29
MKELKDLKIKDLTKVNEMTQAALKKETISAQKSYFTLQMKKSLGELKQTHLMKFMRRYIAQLRTVAKTKGFNI